MPATLSGYKTRGRFSTWRIFMRMSKLFSQTLREAPTAVDLPSHRLLLRAGFIRQLAPGIFSYLSLAQKSLTKIENIIRDEMNAIGGQEIVMPIVNPAEIWQESGRWYDYEPILGHFTDKNGHKMVLAVSSEEALSELARNEIRSYRQLPQLLYQFQKKWYDDSNPRSGLLKAREFILHESFSLDKDQESFIKQYESHNSAYQNIFNRCQIPMITIRSNSGPGQQINTDDYVYVSSAGDDLLLICDNCSYRANIQVAQTRKTSLNGDTQLPVEIVSTPGAKTIDALASYLSIPKHQTAKAVFLVATQVDDLEKIDRFVFAIVRGDMDVNENKIKSLLNAINLRPATDDEIIATGAVPGYASPVGLKDILIVVDDIIPSSPNLVSGANKEGFHLRNVNYGRDYKADIIADITLAREGDGCIACGHSLRAHKAIKVGMSIRLGTNFSEKMKCYYLDNQGQTNPIVMGSYKIDLPRLLACIAEEHHDEHGLIWPISISPYQVHLITLASKKPDLETDGIRLAERLYQDFSLDNIECLYDERDESPGVKFNDADLIGIPIRLTIGERSLNNGGVEYKRRDKVEKVIIPYKNIIPVIKKELQNLYTNE
jgi:prolyl-tRNA synthetase